MEQFPREVGTRRRFKLTEKIGSGGMATLYKAETPEGRIVALKMMNPQVFGVDPEILRKQFAREVEISAQVKSPYFPRFIGADQGNEPPFFVMELIEGVSLDQLAQSDGPLSEREVCDLGVAVCNALLELHFQQVLHRDLKPSNIMMTPNGIVVIDFGAARAALLTGYRSGNIRFGTPLYAAPEILDGKPASEATEVYALGVTLAYASCREHHLSDAIPERLRRIIRPCLERDPAKRPSVSQLKRSLSSLRDSTLAPTQRLVPKTMPYTLLLRGTTQPVTPIVDPGIEPRPARGRARGPKQTPPAENVVEPDLFRRPVRPVNPPPAVKIPSNTKPGAKPVNPHRPRQTRVRPRKRRGRMLAAALALSGVVGGAYQTRDTWIRSLPNSLKPGPVPTPWTEGAMLLCATGDACASSGVGVTFQLQVINVGTIKYMRSLCGEGYRDNWTTAYKRTAPVSIGSSCGELKMPDRPKTGDLIAANFQCPQPGAWTIAWDLTDPKGTRVIHLTHKMLCK